MTTPNPTYIRVSFEQGTSIDALAEMFSISRLEVERYLREQMQERSTELVDLRSKSH